LGRLQQPADVSIEQKLRLADLSANVNRYHCRKKDNFKKSLLHDSGFP
jgi:hypothetical protein